MYAYYFYGSYSGFYRRIRRTYLRYDPDAVSYTHLEASGGDDITITVSSRYSNDNPDENYFRQKVEEFNAMDNGITVVMDNISTESDYLDKLRTSFANGDTPDVFQEYGGSRCLDYLEADALVDLKPYLEDVYKRQHIPTVTSF